MAGTSSGLATLTDYLRTLSDTAVSYAWWARVATLSKVARRKREDVPAERRVLLVAPTLPPGHSGGVFRPLHLLCQLVERGWNATAIARQVPTSPTEAGLDLETRIPSSVSILRVNKPTLRPSWSFFPDIDGGFVRALAIFDLAKTTERPTVILATGPNFETFVAGYYISRYFRSRLVLDYRDEWTECPFPFVRKRNADRFWEKLCLRQADAVVFTTETQRRHQLEVFSELDPAKAHVIPNGWQPEDFSPTGAGDNAIVRDKILISFVGTLRHTPPGPFLADVEDVIRGEPNLKSRLRLRFIGSKGEEATRQLASFPHQELLESMDPVAKKTANSMMKSSDALLLLNPPPLERYRPGKMYEYVAAGRPILVYGTGGEVGDLVTRLNAGFVVPEGDTAGLAKAIRSIDAGTWQPSDHISTWLQEHTRDATSGRFVDVLEGL